MSVKLLTEHNLEFLSLQGGCSGSPESTHVKLPHCWKSHVRTQIFISNLQQTRHNIMLCSVYFQGQEGANTILQDIDKILRKATSQLCEQINETQPLNINSNNLGILADKFPVTL